MIKDDVFTLHINNDKGRSFGVDDNRTILAIDGNGPDCVRGRAQKLGAGQVPAI